MSRPGTLPREERRRAAASCCSWSPSSRVQVAGVHDAEGCRPAGGSRAVEVLGGEAVRDRDDRACRASSGNALASRRCTASGVLITIAAAVRERATHPREVAPTVQRARVDHHLVERPGIAEIGHPRLSEPPRELGAGEGRVVGLHPDVDQVDVGTVPARRGQCCPRSTSATTAGAGTASARRVHASARFPPARPRPGGAELELAPGSRRRASRPRAPSGLRSRRRPVTTMRLVAELVQEAGHPQRSLRARAADRREVVRVKEQAPPPAGRRRRLHRGDDREGA